MLAAVNLLLVGVALGGLIRLFVKMYPTVRREDFIAAVVIIWLGLCGLAEYWGIGPVGVALVGIGGGAGLLIGDYVARRD